MNPNWEHVGRVAKVKLYMKQNLLIRGQNDTFYDKISVKLFSMLRNAIPFNFVYKIDNELKFGASLFWSF